MNERLDHGIAPEIVQRFWSHVQRAEGDACWLWTGKPNSHGYGRVSMGQRHNVLAHRLSYVLHVGPLDKNECALHRCDTPACVRPDHLFKGDRGDNARDMAAKGRTHLQRHPSTFRGDRHWKRQQPERVKTRSLACSNCGELTTSWKQRRRGRCVACDAYFQKHSIERPRDLWGESPRRRRKETT